MKTFLICLYCICLAFAGYSQSMVNVTLDHGIFHSYSGVFGSGVSFHDFNRDGWPDLTFPNKNENPFFYINTGGSFELYNLQIENSNDIRCALWVDYDNDGDSDLSISRALGQFDLYNNNNGNFVNISASASFPEDEFHSYGHTWADYDLDGDLDVYLANYEQAPFGENVLLENMGDGTFENVTEFAGVGNGHQFSFMGNWFDFNNDLWPDLYVINDKAHPNALYMNNGDGTFTDISAMSDAGIVSNPMTNTMGDYDNDGDLDIYMSNTDLGNHLLKQEEGGYFWDVADSADVQLFAMSWGATFTDFDQDMWQDLLVCTGTILFQQEVDVLYRNNANGGFNYAPEWFDPGQHNNYCPAEGDFDNDGDPDLVISCQFPSVSELWENQVSNHGYIKFSLQGVISNRDAIGTKIEVYTGDTYQMHYSHCGENYMGQPSQYELFGLGNYVAIDSVVVTWPLGHQDILYNLDANQTIPLIEGMTLSNSIALNGSPYLCDGDSLTLISEEFSEYIWSNGSTESEISVSEEGEYFVLAFNEDGLLVYSDTISVLASTAPSLTDSLIHVACQGDLSGSIHIELEGGNPPFLFEWSNDSQENPLIHLAQGEYEVDIYDQYGCIWHSLSYLIQEPEFPLGLSYVSYPETLGEGNGSIELIIEGGTPPYIINWSNESNEEENIDLETGTYTVIVTDINGCTAEESIDVEVITGIEGIEENGLSLYPNPAQNEIFIKLNKSVDFANIYNSAGKLILSPKTSNGSIWRIDISELGQGIYWIILEIDDEMVRRSFFKGD